MLYANTLHISLNINNKHSILCAYYFQIAFDYKTNKIETVYKSLLVEISSEKYTTLVPYTHTQKNNLKIMSQLKKIPLKKLKI